jgi:hypothetical protein
MMTLTEFEMHCHKVFADRLPGIRDAAESEQVRLMGDLMTELEAIALATVEVCTRGAYLLTLALYDIHLHMNADALGVDAEYFTSEDRHEELDALEYLHARRCDLPPTQFITVH